MKYALFSSILSTNLHKMTLYNVYQVLFNQNQSRNLTYSHITTHNVLMIHLYNYFVCILSFEVTKYITCGNSNVYVEALLFTSY